MSKPKLLDLFCGAGGAGMGYHRAGFEVTGIDIKPQPNYPFNFIQTDALHYVSQHWQEYDMIHASPPCQRFSSASFGNHVDKFPDLLGITRYILKIIGKPYIIENVPGAPMKDYIILCGTMFGLQVIRHRHFEIKPNPILLMPPHKHDKKVARQGYAANLNIQFACVTGDQVGKRFRVASKAMNIDWMRGKEISQAIPPAYTEFIGKHMMTLFTEQLKASA